MTNALAFYNIELIAVVKRFILPAPNLTVEFLGIVHSSFLKQFQNGISMYQITLYWLKLCRPEPVRSAIIVKRCFWIQIKFITEDSNAIHTIITII